ncbi:hypothetical protein [Actinoplanes aureus]|uniref:DUF3558 domain-containing protein n=1 Tax=Actinoplanes aureus TaxID=2792083 RepID=A0A931C7D3_9ACTN|nr:hypothetical protein [Actinoplanes aureus]MBG0562326.1 hypothetical protein [Actinoplanes aureus]
MTRMAGAVAAVLLAGVLAGCGSGSSLDCGEQSALARTLAGDAALERAPASARAGAIERNFPCRDQDGFTVSASRHYELPEPVSFDEIAELAGMIAEPADWAEIGRVPPEWGGAMFCYRSTAGDVHRYLTVTTDDAVGFDNTPPPGFRDLLVRVFQAETEQDLCRTTGRGSHPARASNGPGAGR